MANERNGFFKDELEISDDENGNSRMKIIPIEAYNDEKGRVRSFDDDYVPPGNDERTEQHIQTESSRNASPTIEDSPKLESRSNNDSDELPMAIQRPKTSRAGASRPESAKRDRAAFDISQFSDPSLSTELKDLFKHISRYSPQEFDLETELKPFLPDYMPAIGDIDAFIKANQKNDLLGLTVLDEPETHQSDPSVLDLHLRAITKSSSAGPRTVRSLDPIKMKKDPKVLETWLKNIKDLHEKKPPASVHYSRRMPDIEDLMQVWPEPIEEALKTIQLPTPEIDLPLPEYATILALLLDIPVPSTSEKVDKRGRKVTPSNKIEALHVLFTLYSEFKNSAHFKAVGRGMESNIVPDNVSNS